MYSVGMYKNSRHQGALGVASATEYFVAKGYPVSKPLFEMQRYDLVVEIDGELKKVECKHTTAKTPYGTYTVALRTLGGNRSWKGKVTKVDGCDLLYVLVDGTRRYLIPASLVSTMSSINVGGNSKWERYKLAT